MDISDSVIGRAYIAKTPKSRVLAERARKVFPSGVTHDSRFLKPYPICVARAQGSHKWDVDGNEMVDYFGGHGSLLLGHNHPVVTAAVQEQISRGTHYGASTELEIQWAELVTKLVPCAEKVRFTSSGTEATQLAMRLTRAFSGKNKVVRCVTHFHGWHDQVAFGSLTHHDGGIPAGITDEMASHIVLVPPNDLEALERTFSESDDIAAIILEPTGSSFGQVPTNGEFLKNLRQLTADEGVLLIFDEVITGFRCAPGGAQAYHNVTPDMSVHAKMLAGGYPGGAVVGRADVLDMMTIGPDAEWNLNSRVPHQGTFNANPVSATAGIAALTLVKTTDACEKANRTTAVLRDQLNSVLREEGLNWLVYGEFSDFHIFTNPQNKEISIEDVYSGKLHYSELKGGDLGQLCRLGFIVGGVDVCGWPGGWLSAVHTDADLDRTVEAFRGVLKLLKEDAALV